MATDPDKTQPQSPGAAEDAQPAQQPAGMEEADAPGTGDAGKDMPSPDGLESEGGRSDIEGGVSGMTGERPLRPDAASERADAIDEGTAGDGVAFFEGQAPGDEDVERSG